MKKYILFIISILLCPSCRQSSCILIKDRLNQNIRYLSLQTTALGKDTLLPILPYFENDSSLQWAFKNPTYEAGTFCIDGKDWAHAFKFWEIDTLRIFILSPDTISKYGWENVRTNYRILVRYDLSYSNIENESGNILLSYPPTPDMRNIKMFPPYEEVLPKRN